MKLEKMEKSWKSLGDKNPAESETISRDSCLTLKVCSYKIKIKTAV